MMVDQMSALADLTHQAQYMNTALSTQGPKVGAWDENDEEEGAGWSRRRTAFP